MISNLAVASTAARRDDLPFHLLMKEGVISVCAAVFEGQEHTILWFGSSTLWCVALLLDNVPMAVVLLCCFTAGVWRSAAGVRHHMHASSRAG
jgi:hypothetical protein